MDITPMELLILSLASFRLTRLIVFDKITEFIRKPFLEEVEEKGEDGETEIYIVIKNGRARGFFGELLSCFWCTGVWSAIFICASYAFLREWAVPGLLVLAVAGLAAIIETVLQKWIDE